MEKNLSQETEELLIIKRDGRKVPYDGNKVVAVIEKAMSEGEVGIDTDLAMRIEQDIFEEINSEIHQALFTVENLQDLVEMGLLEHGRYETAKRYIKYRLKQEEIRKDEKPNSDENVDEYKHLTDDFISEYKHKPNPFPSQLSEMVFYRTYSRFLKKKGRREYWWETCRRAVEYNTNIVSTDTDEAKELYDLMYNLKGFLSGRTLYSGNTYVSKNYPMSNFNCAFQVTDTITSFTDGFYLLLLGCGYGFRVFKDDISKLPSFRKNVELINQDYRSIPKGSRKEISELTFHGDTIAQITVADSKIGWVKAMEFYLKLMTDPMYFTINTIAIDYDNVRPFGERLVTFGGTASGHEALLKMFDKIHSVIEKRGSQTQDGNIRLTSVDCLDIHTSIAEGVVVGGTRRSAEIGLGEVDDKEFINAKNSLYTEDSDGNWIIDKSILNRQMSNNTVLFYKKPERLTLKNFFDGIRKSGEPAMYNGEEALRRNPYFSGTNACSEILLDSSQMCNLVTIATSRFVENGILNKKEMLRAFKIITRANLRMSCVELELFEWNLKQQRDRLLGVSLTGWQDMVNATGMSKNEQRNLLIDLRKVVDSSSEEYAQELGVNAPLLTTCLKPEGTISQLALCSSGLHYSHSPYFTRRVRVNATEPLARVCEDLGYPIAPEIGQDMETCTTKVVEFPVIAPEGKTKYQVSAIEQLEDYKMFMETYVSMNASITVHVRSHEWEEVEEWVWNNWDSVIGISFLSLDDSFYELLPYEAITKEQYEKNVSCMKKFKPELISEYEKVEFEADISLNDGCESGHCPVR